MGSSLTTLAFILFVFIAGFLLWRYWLQRADEKLRNNPPPKRIIRVALPKGVTGSANDMARFYRKIASLSHVDPASRRHGLGQIDFLYVASVQSEGATPELYCLIMADPDRMDNVKKALKNSFTAIDVVEIEDNFLFDYASQMRPNEKKAENKTADIPPEIASQLPDDLSDEEKVAIMQQLQGMAKGG